MSLKELMKWTEKLIRDVLNFSIAYLQKHPELLQDENVIDILLKKLQVQEGKNKVKPGDKNKQVENKNKPVVNKKKIIVKSVDSEEEIEKPKSKIVQNKKVLIQKSDSENEEEEEEIKSSMKKIEKKEMEKKKEISSKIALKVPEKSKEMKPIILNKGKVVVLEKGKEDKEEDESEKEKSEKEENEEIEKKEDEVEKPKKKLKFNQTITITMGNAAENRIGMEIIGNKDAEGFNLKDLERAKAWFEEKGIVCELICLNDFLPKGKEKELKLKADKAYLLIARKGMSAICNPDAFYEEQLKLKPDKKAWSKGSVVNLHARYNLCFNKKSQVADYENKKGTIIAYKDVPLLDKVRTSMKEIIGKKGSNLVAEGNYYPSPQNDSFIGLHGDFERKTVIASRVGMNMLFHYQWFYKFEPISEMVTFDLEHGTIYFMSDKSVGYDWKRPSIITLRHSAGPIDKVTWKPKKRTAKK